MKQFTFSDYVEEKIPEGMVKVKFLKSVPRFVGINLRLYGSYIIGDTDTIPILNSIGLKKKGACI